MSCRQPCSLLTAALAAATVLAVLAPCAAHAQADKDGLLIRITAAGAKGEEFQRARGVIAQMVAYYSRIPGLVLLEGDPVLEQKRQEEIRLSQSGLVDEDSRVQDRTMKAEVTVTLGGVRIDPESRKATVTVTAEGPRGKGQTTLTFGHASELTLFVDELMRKVVPAGWASRFEGGCIEEGVHLGLLVHEACVAAIFSKCRASSSSQREHLSCMADRGHQIHHWAKDAQKHPERQVPMSPAQARVLEEVQKGGKPNEADMVHLKALMENIQAFQAALKQTIEAFRPRFVAAMQEVVHEGFIYMTVSPDTPIKQMRVAGVRWNRLDPGPLVLFDIQADPGTRKAVKTLFGKEQEVIEDVHSFGLRGFGDGAGKVFEYRLLCLGRGPTDCNVQTSLDAEYFRKTQSVVWFEPDWRHRM